MQNVLIVGAGKGGLAILQLFSEIEMMKVIAIVDRNEKAAGIQLAKKMGIETGNDWRNFLNDELDVVVEATGDKETFNQLHQEISRDMLLIPGSVAYIISQMMDEKKELIRELENQSYIQDLILNSTHDGMIAIDANEKIILLNRMAEKMMNVKKGDVIGEPVTAVIRRTELPRVLTTRRIEINKEFEFQNGQKIVTTRIPMVNESGQLLGAIAVFKDITEVVNLAEEITNLKDIQMMLEAIIQSSEEAISVVDENGVGIMINPAYTKLTGLSEEDVVGKPATADISEGESMHMQVLETKKPVRGARMKVGPYKKDVIVNAAPVIVDGKLKGSVGVIHDVSEIKTLTKELQRARQIIRTLEAKYSFDDIIGTSEEMTFAIEQAKLGARTPATVLLRGESGTGKELFAHAIHNGSDRKYNKFIRVNCAAIPEALLESELFGYEEGAFTGAKRGGKIGLFEESNHGSIFLDEIGELSLSTQVKLLRVLQESEIVRVGGTKAIPINVRIIAATNVNLEKGISEGRIREDLYYRINRLPIHIPSLRKRKEDIPLLCMHLISKLNQDYGRNIEGLTDAALLYLSQYHWPGNVRELENILGRAIIHMKFNEVKIHANHIPPLSINIDEEEKRTIREGDDQTTQLSTLVERFERDIISESLSRNNGNKTATAKALGVSLRNLYYKIEKYKL
jgi:PAS domain S-box-containing protein